MEIHDKINGILETRALPKEKIQKSIRERLDLKDFSQIMWILLLLSSVILVILIIY